MNDADALVMATRYRTSIYDVKVDPSKAVKGHAVPKVKGAELVAAMEENVEQAKARRDSIKIRFEEATRDGLFEIEALEATSNGRARIAWVDAIQTQHGDKIRCLAELHHWREYLGWAMRKAAGEGPQREAGSDDD
jgi:hypothetical protein